MNRRNRNRPGSGKIAGQPESQVPANQRLRINTIPCQEAWGIAATIRRVAGNAALRARRIHATVWTTVTISISHPKQRSDEDDHRNDS